MLCKCSRICWLHKRFLGSCVDQWESLVFLAILPTLLWLLLSPPWRELWRAKGGPPGDRGCGGLGARGIRWAGDSWPLSGCCREAGACRDIHFVGLEQPKGSSTLVFFPISWALPLRALEWELQRPKCELNCLFSWKVLMLFLWKGIECSDVEFMGHLASPLNCHVVNRIPESCVLGFLWGALSPSTLTPVDHFLASERNVGLVCNGLS